MDHASSFRNNVSSFPDIRHITCFGWNMAPPYGLIVLHYKKREINYDREGIRANKTFFDLSSPASPLFELQGAGQAAFSTIE